MWELLCKEGFTGGYTTVKDAVRQLRKQAPKEVFMPLTQPPGEAQVDFGYALVGSAGTVRPPASPAGGSTTRRHAGVHPQLAEELRA